MLDEQAGLPRVLAAIRADGTEELYAYGPDGLLAQRTRTSSSDQTSYALLDAQASLLHLADSAGSLTLTRVYDAWGSLRFTSGTASSRLGYTGELQTGALVYLRARWYHTGLGTFTSRDTFMGVPTRPSSLHRYLYTEGNPANFSDPSGQCVPEGRFFGDAGCQWIWDVGAGVNWYDGAMWFWHVFQNLGLPGAIASDLVNSLAGRPSNMAEQIIQQDGRAAVLGGLFRDLATAGAGRLPQVAQLVAGWSFAKSTEQMLCSPASLNEQLGYGAQTVVLLLTLKGGSTTLTLPGGGTGPAWSTAAGSIWSDVQQAVVVTVPTQQLAGAVAGQPGLVVLLVKGNGGSGSGGTKYKQWPKGSAASPKGAELASKSQGVWNTLKENDVTIAMSEADGKIYVTTNGGAVFQDPNSITRLKTLATQHGWEFVPPGTNYADHAELHLYRVLTGQGKDVRTIGISNPNGPCRAICQQELSGKIDEIAFPTKQ